MKASVLSLLVVCLSACGGQPAQPQEPQPAPHAAEPASPQEPAAPSTGAPTTQIANPASTFCVERGGTVVIRETPEGQVGDCHLPDGRVIEEWAFFRSEHAQPGSP